MDFILLLLLFLFISFIFSYFIRKKTNFENQFYLLTLLRTQKPIEFFKVLANKFWFLNYLAEISLFLGFGALSVDFVYGKKLKKPHRILIFVISFLLLILFFFFIDSVFNKSFSQSPLTKNYFLILSIIFGIFGFSGFVLFVLFLQAFDIFLKLFSGKTPCPGIAPVVPGVEIPNVPLVIPLHAWISLIIIMIVHESMHGIIATMHKLKIKSTGIVLLGFLPIGAFVEPDDKELEEKEREDPVGSLRFLAAGSGGNLFLMPLIFLFLLFFSIIFSLFFYTTSYREFLEGEQIVYISKVDQNVEFCGDIYESPAYKNLDVNWQILKINGNKVNNLSTLSQEIMKNRFGEITLTLKTLDGNILEKRLKPNDLGVFGFSVSAVRKDSKELPKDYLFLVYLFKLVFDFFNWFFMLTFIVAIGNFLPVLPFDGGRIAPLILSNYLFLTKPLEKRKKVISLTLISIVFILFVLNIIPLFL